MLHFRIEGLLNIKFWSGHFQMKVFQIPDSKHLGIWKEKCCV